MHPIFQQMWEAEWDDAMPVGYIVTHEADWNADTNPVSLMVADAIVSRGWDYDVSLLAVLPFRLLDDDGNVCYVGRLVDDDDVMSQDAALSFGMNDAGCTRIEVLRGGGWVQEIA
jgi:hypothetical protein